MGLFWKHFHGGQFQKCISILEELVDLSDKISLIDVSNKFNLQLCKLLLSVVRRKSDGGHKSDLLLIQDGENATQNLLNKVKSFPSTPEWIGLELTVLYNLIYFQLWLSNLKKHDWSFVLKRSVDQLKTTLYRVLMVLCPNSCVQNCDDDIAELTEKLVESKHLLKVYNIVDSVCLVVSIHALGLMHCGNTFGALRCLEALQPLVAYDMDLIKLHPELGILVFSSNPGVERITDMTLIKLTDVINFSLGVCFHRSNQGHKCRTVLEKVTYRPWKNHAAYLIGNSLLSDKMYNEAVNHVDIVLSQDADCSSELRAKLFNLQGSCFTELNLHHSAIAVFKQALELDFSVMSVYNISLQYKQLGLSHEQIEMLNLLNTIVEDKVCTDGGSQFVFDSLFTEHLPVPRMSLLQVKYLLASQCRQLDRFSEAAEKYLDFLAEVGDPSCTNTNLQESEMCVVKLPDIVTVYSECAFCLLMCGKLSECVAVCTTALDTCSKMICVVDDKTSELEKDALFACDDVTVQNTDDKSFYSKKRPHSDSCEHANMSKTESWQEVETWKTLVCYKADALVQLVDLNSAASTLHKFIEHLQEYTFTDRENTSPTVQKKRRRTNDGKVINPENGDINNGGDSSTGRWRQVLCETCINLAIILNKMDKLSDSLHYCRLAIQMDPENSKAWYTCCLVLQKTGHQYESVISWLKHRLICHQSDTFQLAIEVKRRQEQLRMVLIREDCVKKPVLLSDSLLPHEFLKMDISSLEHLLKVHQSKQFAY